MKMHGIILACGLSLRGRALSNSSLNARSLPKAMWPVGQRRVIDFAIEALKHHGLDIIHVVTGPPEKHADSLEHHLVEKNAYNVKINVHRVERNLDTLEVLKYLTIDKTYLNAEPNDFLCVFACDNVMNLDFKSNTAINFQSILTALSLKKPAVLVPGLPIKWSSQKWRERSFGTIQIGIMPSIREKDYARDRGRFETDLENCTRSLSGECLKVDGFLEKQERNLAQSNLIDPAIYYIKVGALNEFSPFITRQDAERPFSDIGKHFLPALGGRSHEFGLPVEITRDIIRERFPFYTMILSNATYWRDIHDGFSLLKANMDYLDGKFFTGIAPGDRFWDRKEWGWIGRDGTLIQGKVGTPKPDTGEVGSVIGSHVTLLPEAEVKRSAVLDHVKVKGRVINSVLFPSSEKEERIIPEDTTVINSLYVGGRILRMREPIQDSIIFPTNNGGFGIDPLRAKKI